MRFLSEKSKILILSTALTSTISVFYNPTDAVAGSCTNTGTNNWECSGAANSALDNTIMLSGNVSDLNVTTIPGFGMDTFSGGDAFNLKITPNGQGNLIFEDLNNSNIAGGTSGFYLENEGTGYINLISNGVITAYGNATAIGVRVTSTITTSGVSLNLANVYAADVGVDAAHSGTGQLSITTSGNILGITGAGIAANSEMNSDGLEMNITGVSEVAGFLAGITFVNSGMGDANIRIMDNSDVILTDNAGGAAIIDFSPSGMITNIYIEDNAEVRTTMSPNAGFATAILGFGGNANVFLGNSSKAINTASVKGAILLGNGSDTVTVDVLDFSDVTNFDGGDDIDDADGFIDTLTFTKGVGAGTVDESLINNWEHVVVDDSTMSFTTSTAGVEELTAGTLTIRNNGILSAEDGFTMKTGFATSGAISGGNFSLIGTGSADMQDGDTDDAFIIEGNFIGSGGTFLLDTELDDGVDPDITDEIMIAGNTSGMAFIDFNNVGGTPGPTGNEPTDGILIVTVDGNSNGIFRVANAPLTAGVITYGLVKADGQNWYLQEILEEFVKTTSALQSALHDDFETLWQRSGNRASNYTHLSAHPADQSSGFWTRSTLSGTSGEIVTTAASMPETNQLDSTAGKIQIGFDHRFNGLENSVVTASAFGHYRQLSLDARDEFDMGFGSAKASGFGAGGALTLVTENGFYADILGQFTVMNVDISTFNNNAQTDTWTRTLSLETGYTINKTGSVRVIPQAQLAWRANQINAFVSQAGSDFQDLANDHIIGRLGVAVEGGYSRSEGGTGFTGYALANLVHEFSDDSNFATAGTKVATDASQTKLEARLGATLSANDDDSFIIFGEGGLSHSIDNLHETTVSGRLGAKWFF